MVVPLPNGDVDVSMLKDAVQLVNGRFETEVIGVFMRMAHAHLINLRLRVGSYWFGTKTTKQASQQLLPFAIQAIQENNSELTKEATDLFIWCLTQNAECYKQWEKLYVENVGATIIVLRKLSTEWLNYSAKISPDTLKVTLKHLRAKNEDSLSRNTDPSQVASIKEADKYCKTILMKLTRNFGCMKGSVLVLMLGIGLFFTLSPNAELINWENINWEKF
ncbi:uncharacterized protein LOC122050235 [Zingiber officinale]|uniref:uncharacterized protein LOC122050235 n=1 Tax=Zingiber officinale TaxID=94328 RepID=UPI001C4ABB13|nr:uncharacterized protein LOC122050235 [Zingiber officinale]